MAGLTVQCKDEMVDGEWLMELKLPVETPNPTVRELITTRVMTETGQHNAELDRGRSFRGLVLAPPSVTSELNGWAGRRREGKAVEPDTMLKIALEAYASGDLIVVVDGEQAGEIDSEVALKDDSSVLFRKKVPLIVPQLNPGRKRSKHEKMPKRR